MNENEIGKIIVDITVGLHKELGPGLLETVYEVIPAHKVKFLNLCGLAALCEN